MINVNCFNFIVFFRFLNEAKKSQMKKFQLIKELIEERRNSNQSSIDIVTYFQQNHSGESFFNQSSFIE